MVSSPTLTTRQKLILRVVQDAMSQGWPCGVDMVAIQRLVKAMEHPEADFPELIGILTDVWPHEFYAERHAEAHRWQDTFERDARALEQFGLAKLSLTPREAPLINLSPEWSIDDYDMKLTPDGERVATAISLGRRLVLRPEPGSSTATTVFVACALGRPDIDEIYTACLAPACDSLGYVPRRIDLAEPDDTITNAILREISWSACVLADLTYARPSVYFEAGYANALGVPLLLTCRRDHHRAAHELLRVHFDLEQYKTSFWERGSEESFEWEKGMSPRERLSQLVSTRA